MDNIARDSAKTINRNKKSRFKLRDMMMGYIFISGFLVLYLVFTVYPLLDGVWISLNRWDIINPMEFVGLQNYINLFQDPVFWTSLGNTTTFVVMSVPSILIVGFLLALLINSRNLKGNAFFRVTFFTPNVLSVAIISYLWVRVLEPYTGLLSNALTAIGFTQEIFWLRDRSLVWISIVLITLWWTVGYNMVLYLASMQDIPESYYESAELDGANAWQKTLYITIPYLKRTHILLFFLQTVASFRIFGQVFLVTGGGPAGATRTYIQFIYETAFQRFFIGTGNAASVILFIIILVVSLLQLRILKATPD